MTPDHDLLGERDSVNPIAITATPGTLARKDEARQTIRVPWRPPKSRSPSLKHMLRAPRRMLTPTPKASLRRSFRTPREKTRRGGSRPRLMGPSRATPVEALHAWDHTRSKQVRPEDRPALLAWTHTLLQNQATALIMDTRSVTLKASTRSQMSTRSWIPWATQPMADAARLPPNAPQTSALRSLDISLSATLRVRVDTRSSYCVGADCTLPFCVDALVQRARPMSRSVKGKQVRLRN